MIQQCYRGEKYLLVAVSAGYEYLVLFNTAAPSFVILTAG